MDGASLNIITEQLEKLKQLFPEVVSEGKIDWDRLKATLGEEITLNPERYVLNCLVQNSEKIIKKFLSLNSGKCIALDKLFTGNDQLKTNTVLQMPDAGVVFKTI